LETNRDFVTGHLEFGMSKGLPTRWEFCSHQGQAMTSMLMR